MLDGPRRSLASRAGDSVRDRLILRWAAAAAGAIVASMVAGGAFAEAACGLAALARLAAPHALTTLTAPGDVQGALLFMPEYQLGLLAGLWIALGFPRWKNALSALAVLLALEAVWLVAIGEWIVHVGAAPHALALRAWNVAVPVGLALVLFSRADSKRSQIVHGPDSSVDCATVARATVVIALWCIASSLAIADVGYAQTFTAQIVGSRRRRIRRRAAGRHGDGHNEETGLQRSVTSADTGAYLLDQSRIRAATRSPRSSPDSPPQADRTGAVGQPGHSTRPVDESRVPSGRCRSSPRRPRSSRRPSRKSA